MSTLLQHKPQYNLTNMQVRQKSTIIVPLLILALCVFAFMGFKGFVNSIRNQRTCEWAIIDNIELHAHIDVPKVTKCDCDYDNISNTKKASFNIDKNNLKTDEYVQHYSLKELRSFTQLDHNEFLNLNKEALVDSHLYYKTGISNGEEYAILFDELSGRLWVTIKYKD